MITITWIALVALAAFGVAAGRLDLALLAGALKALLVGFVFMELPATTRLHRWLFVAWVVVVVTLVLMVGRSTS